MRNPVRNCCTAGVMLLLSGCMGNTVLHSSAALPHSHWEKEDTLVFPVDSLIPQKAYTLQVEVRTTSTYPYSSLYVIVEQDWGTREDLLRDTIPIEIAKDQEEDRIFFTSSASQPLQFLAKQKEGVIRVYHYMKREDLSGISDVGLRVSF